MTPREMVLAAFRFEKTDRIPYQVLLEDEMIIKLNEYYGTDAWQQDVLSKYLYAYGVAWPGDGKDIGNGLIKDVFGAIVKPGNIPHVIQPALAGPSLDGYRWPDPEELVDVRKTRAILAAHEDAFRLLSFSLGYMERGIYMRGLEDFLVDMIENPEFMDEFTEQYRNLKLKVYDLFKEIGSFEGIFSGGDDCDQRGCIMGINLWRRFIKPHLAIEIERTHQMDKYFVMHSCGNVMPIIDDLAEMKIDALDPLQPEPMDIFELKKKLRGKVVMIGGMGSQSTIPFGTPDEVRLKSELLLKNLGEGGGYIISNCKHMYGDTPVENAAAFIEAVTHQSWGSSL